MIPDRDRLRRIFGLALPIIGAMVSQNVLNLVDTALVGAIGEAAMAAVSTASFFNFMCIAFVTGLSSGVQAMAARRHGEGSTDRSAAPLNEGLLLALLIGAPASVVLIAMAPTLFPYVNDDPEVVAHAVPYLQARLVAMTAIGMNFAFRGFWSAIDRTRLYMITLFTMHSANILLSWALIGGHLGLPELGSLGAGVGAAIANWLGTLVYFGMGLAFARENGFLRSLPTAANLRGLLSLALPSSIQQLMFAAGMTLLLAIIGTVGRSEAAAAGVLINVTLVALLPGMGLGIAAGSLVSQALGRKDPEDAWRWGWQVTTVGAVLMGLIGLPMVLFPRMLLTPFLPQSPEAVDAGVLPLAIAGAALGLDAVGMVLTQALLGAGAAARVMAVSITIQWLLFLPAAYLVGPVFGGGLLAIWIASVLQRTLLGAVLARMWQSRDWATIRV